MLSFGIAKELGKSVSQVWGEMTRQEILAWSCYFEILSDKQEKAMKDARKRGRR